MSKLIIDNQSDLSDWRVLYLVQQVINGGRVSNNDKQYCYLTSFKLREGIYIVATDLNKKSDRFVIYKEN